jgi:hypothetical protein
MTVLFLRRPIPTLTDFYVDRFLRIVVYYTKLITTHIFTTEAVDSVAFDMCSKMRFNHTHTHIYYTSAFDLCSKMQNHHL